MERYISEFVTSNLTRVFKGRNGVWIWFAEAKCNYAATISSLKEDLAKYQCTIEKLSLQIQQISTPFESEEMLYNDEKVVLLKGLPNFKDIIWSCCENHANWENWGKLSLFQQFTCCLMKLRLNCPGLFLASMFDMATSNVSRIFLFKVVSTNGHRPTGLDNLARARKFAENNAGLFSRVVWEESFNFLWLFWNIYWISQQSSNKNIYLVKLQA